MKEKRKARATNADLKKTQSFVMEHINQFFPFSQFKYKKTRCFRCMKWVNGGAVSMLWERPRQLAVAYDICSTCHKFSADLPSDRRRLFFEKIEDNLLRFLEVRNNA